MDFLFVFPPLKPFQLSLNLLLYLKKSMDLCDEEATPLYGDCEKMNAYYVMERH